ncbi:MAG: carbohydrate ABC transporter permease [Chloroflexi bacterium]|nr:MAG: carbohydrate ABC transporter permease [Chloroflexota bacterium]
MDRESVGGVETAVSLPITHRLRKLVLYALLLAAALMMLIPFLWMISTSLKADEYVLSIPLQFIPRPFTFESYQRLTEIYPMPRMFWNSLVVAVLTTGGQLIVSAMAAYAFSRIEFRGRNVLFVLYLATLMIPSQVTIIPLFILMRYLGWINTYPGLIIPGIFSAFGTFLLRQFFLTLPKELEEAAFIDGASRWTIFWRIIMPLSRPALATLGVFAFMGSWNSFLWPLFIVRNEQLMTLPVGLATLHGRWLTQWNLVMAGAVITIIPMLIVYLFAQRYFVQGVVTTGLKG